MATKTKTTRKNRKEEARRELLRTRYAALLEKPLDCVYNEEFEDPSAEEKILGPVPEGPEKKGRLRAPSGLPPYLASLYEVPLLTKEQEVYYFRKMNFLKFHAAELLATISPYRPSETKLVEAERMARESAEIKNLLVRRNLRLVVAVAKKYARGDQNFFEVVSDGNISLMRAVDKFDYARGFKFSTYATWAIKRNFARSIPAEYTQLGRFRTGHEEMFQHSFDRRGSQYREEIINQGQREAVGTILARLQDRERDIIAMRYGLMEGTEPQTLQQVGERLGVTKERVRQLEARALRKLREIAAEEKLDVPGI